MAKTFLLGTVKGNKKKRKTEKEGEDNIKDWTGLAFGESIRAFEDREGWRRIVETSSVMLH